MSRPHEIALAKAVYSLQGTNGPAWEDFMRALVARADHLTDLMIAADNANIHRMQGSVQEARNLLTALAEARKLADRVAEEERKRQHGTATHPPSA